MRLLVCGGAGFIGSTFARQRLREHGDEVTVLDKLTYAGREENLADVREQPGFQFLRGAIEDPDAVATAVAASGAQAIVNFAAETHVDRSIAQPDAFVNTHALGTYVLLEAAREHSLRYVQVSTDEVYGSIEEGTFTEQSPLAPSSPYSATKAGADLLVQSYHHTYGLDAAICRGSNNYGPYQYPEKLIPLMILNAHPRRSRCRSTATACRSATGSTPATSRPPSGACSSRALAGEVYNAGGPDEEANIDVVGRIVALTGAERVPDRTRHRQARPRPPLLAVLREGARRSAGAPGSASPRGSSRPSAGTARTRGGGSRSARASTAPTTSASTAAP